MSSSKPGIKIFQEVIRKQGSALRNPHKSGINGTAPDISHRSICQGIATPRVVVDNVPTSGLSMISRPRTAYITSRNTNPVTTEWNALCTTRSIHTNHPVITSRRDFASAGQDEKKGNPECGIDDKKCETARPMTAVKDSSACRRPKGCSPQFTDHCYCEPRNKPRPLENKRRKCPPKLQESELRCPTKFTLPIPHCTLPVSIRCGMRLPTKKVCQKIEAPVPSYSECLRAMTKPPMLTECRISEKYKYLQPSERMFVPRINYGNPPEVDTYLDPCIGTCCKLIIKDFQCPPMAADAGRPRCMFMGKNIIFEGCDAPISLDCTQQIRKECDRLLAPVPSFSECIKQDFRRLPYTECSIATQKAKDYADIKSRGKIMTVEVIDANKCISDDKSWNCNNYKPTNTCPPTSTPLECRKGKRISKNKDCPISDADCDVVPYKKAK